MVVRKLAVRVLAWIAVMTLGIGGFVFSAGAETAEQYTENSLNFVEGSMDTSAGIPENASGVLARIKEKGVLRVATEPYFAPQEFIDPDLSGQEQYVGADMKLARLIAERMGVELVIVEMDFTQVLSAVSNDVCDLAISALSFIPSRAVTNAMSKGYYYSSVPKTVMIIRAEDAESIVNVQDLKGKILIAQQGSLQESMVAANVAKYMEFRRTAQTQTVYSAVMQGDADAGAVDAETAQEFIENNPDCGLVIASDIEFLLQEDYQGDRIAAKKGENQLMYFVNGVIDEALADNLYEQWIAEARIRAAELGL